jgi:hypothetical protein
VTEKWDDDLDRWVKNGTENVYHGGFPPVLAGTLVEPRPKREPHYDWPEAFRYAPNTKKLTPENCTRIIDYAADAINSPQHYARWKMQPVEFAAVNNLPWWLANVLKYIMRYDAKDGLKDLYQARSYLDMKIREVEGVERFWEVPVAAERKSNAGS